MASKIDPQKHPNLFEVFKQVKADLDCDDERATFHALNGAWSIARSIGLKVGPKAEVEEMEGILRDNIDAFEAYGQEANAAQAEQAREAKKAAPAAPTEDKSKKAAGSAIERKRRNKFI